MKEKIGMEKLLNLLNEFDPYIARDGEHRDNLWGYAYKGHSAVFPKELAESYIVSARYGFIGWLVENDKIEEGNFFYNTGDLPDDEVSKLLMLLAIQDEPIRFLISILK